MKCNCQDWTENIKFIDEPFLFLAARNPGGGYRGKPFKCCPWCSTELFEESSNFEKKLIPFIYTSLKNPKFQLDSINQGIVYCKKSGYEPYEIILGKEEQKEMEGWSYSGMPVEMKYVIELFGLKVVKHESESFLGFNCKPHQFS